MKKGFYIVLLIGSMSFAARSIKAQCSICAKTTQQMGEKPAKGFNSAIIYLMLAPLGVMSYLGYKWWKGEGN
ncbi:MAG: hypothetical protein NVSMB45_05330 [Ginsengibacter sp.]